MLEGLVAGILGAGPSFSRRKPLNPEDLQKLYRYYQLAGVGNSQTAYATAMWSGLANMNALRPPDPEPDGVPGSHPLERILDGLEKSGPERIEKFL